MCVICVSYVLKERNASGQNLRMQHIIQYGIDNGEAIGPLPGGGGFIELGPKCPTVSPQGLFPTKFEPTDPDCQSSVSLCVFYILCPVSAFYVRYI